MFHGTKIYVQFKFMTNGAKTAGLCFSFCLFSIGKMVIASLWELEPLTIRKSFSKNTDCRRNLNVTLLPT